MPLKKLIPRIANISKANPLIKVTFPSSGMARNKAFTTNLRLSFLDIILKGLNALRARSDLKLFKAEDEFYPIIRFPKLAKTTTKSRTFHPTFK